MYPNALITWTDNSTSDVDAASRFYAEVLGWVAEDQFMDGEHVYTMFLKDGKLAAGLIGLSADSIAMGVSSMWTTYVGVEDFDAVAATFAANGGRLLVEPMDVGDKGRMASRLDPTGAAIGFWQPGTHLGADAFNDPGFMTWNELVTRDVDRALAFYPSVLPWAATPMEGAPEPYHLFMLGERPNAGVIAMPEDAAPDVASHWAVYFAVEDADATAARAVELGATVGSLPYDSGVGRIVALVDPFGAPFSIVSPPTE